MPLLTADEVIRQSNAVFNQFGESKWIPFAKENMRLPRKRTESLAASGVGKFMVSCAMGETLEEKVELIKKYRDRYDVITNDKCFGPLLERGVKADIVVLCDCNVLYKNIEPYINETKGVKLFATPYANIEWTTKWLGDRYFFINKDAIQSERHFLPLFGDDAKVVPAGSNVSNAMLVYMLGIDDQNRVNFMGYENYLLVGYDYSWRRDGNYYAWANPIPKRYYMNHRTLIDIRGNVVQSSENLTFSARWLVMYVANFGLPVTNCSGRGLLMLPRMADFEAAVLKLNSDGAIRDRVRQSYEKALAAKNAYLEAKEAFEKKREELIK